MIKFISIFYLIIITNIHTVFAQSDTIQIQTSAICKTCKKTIESELSFEKGIKKSSLNLDDKVLTVIFDSKKTNPEKIRIAVTKIGYDADTLKADEKAFNRLPECCKNPELMH